MTTQSAPSEPHQSTGSNIQGIGGWLLLLIVKMWISAIGRLLAGIVAGFSFLGAANVFFGALAVVSAYLLSSKNPKAPTCAKLFLVLDAGYYLLEIINALIGKTMVESSTFPAWYKPSGYLFASLIWIAYLVRSERVANTYS